MPAALLVVRIGPVACAAATAAGVTGLELGWLLSRGAELTGQPAAAWTTVSWLNCSVIRHCVAASGSAALQVRSGTVVGPVAAIDVVTAPVGASFLLFAAAGGAASEAAVLD